MVGEEAPTATTGDATGIALTAWTVAAMTLVEAMRCAGDAVAGDDGIDVTPEAGRGTVARMAERVIVCVVATRTLADAVATAFGVAGLLFVALSSGFLPDDELPAALMSGDFLCEAVRASVAEDSRFAPSEFSDAGVLPTAGIRTETDAVDAIFRGSA